MEEEKAQQEDEEKVDDGATLIRTSVLKFFAFIKELKSS